MKKNNFSRGSNIEDIEGEERVKIERFLLSIINFL